MQKYRVQYGGHAGSRRCKEAQTGILFQPIKAKLGRHRPISYTLLQSTLDFIFEFQIFYISRIVSTHFASRDLAPTSFMKGLSTVVTHQCVNLMREGLAEICTESKSVLS